MELSVSLLLSFASSVILIIGSYKVLFRRRKGALPPGPRPWPIVGNIPELPKNRDWRTYEKWAKEYGSVVSLSLGIFGDPMIIINKFDIARDLMNGRSANSADRPFLISAEAKGDDWMISSASGHPHKVRRAIASRYYSGPAAKNYQIIQQDETHDLLCAIAASPDDLHNHLKRFGANIVLLSTYGYRIQESSDPVLVRIHEGIKYTDSDLGILGFLLETFPMLRYYPTWLPFSGFQKKLASSREVIMASLRDEPFAKSKRLIAEGNAMPCLVSTLLEDGPDETQENLIRDCAGVMYAAGADSTAATLYSFFLGATLFPSFYKQAQQELDTVIGGDRLPTIHDRLHLPFTEAVVLELLRWNVVTPLGIPHRVISDDFYEGMLIPAGATITANEWTILHDPVTFPNPDTFDPYRFLGPGSEERKEIVGVVWG
ncbi:hypothetical protein PILCRDRAFT_818691 [Piloderma croceum F 1598]|uniref:Cytochrome P450 n=1 Tax=Piloderma croceum (strain F 1598) TaxID=765440 RepID=A0A0C3FXS1_PILCF|nr:hypothetical protein PILCRDRAFT_818691 [Piloderma croceum F 1598]